ncbi:hypothetical protein GCM10023082_19630 [Streptomyces tremellae]|uniref:Uncharacterized protein n=1 Tax=Streptomyces tremellae TaxID=1124239 RepID=A0ABP7ENU4_9ACTN
MLPGMTRYPSVARTPKARFLTVVAALLAAVLAAFLLAYAR